MEDLERNDGSMQKPYYMSKNLMKILNKKNKQPKKAEDWQKALTSLPCLSLPCLKSDYYHLTIWSKNQL